jgi:hypothetical protein
VGPAGVPRLPNIRFIILIRKSTNELHFCPPAKRRRIWLVKSLYVHWAWSDLAFLILIVTKGAEGSSSYRNIWRYPVEIKTSLSNMPT